MEAPPVGFNWTGGYVGAQVGYAWGDSYFQVDEEHYDATIDPEGFFGGLYGGYNYQFTNNVVLGLDADINASDIDGTVALNHGGSPMDGVDMTGDVKYTAAVRGRLGYAVDRWLPYIAGGVSVAKYEFTIDDGTTTYPEEDTFTGWNIGAGVEFAATDNIIIRGEYRYTDFGDWNGFSEWDSTDGSADLSTNDIRLGIAYKF